MWDGRVPEGGDMRCNNCSESLCVRLKSDDTLQQIWAGFLSTLPVVCPSKPKPPKPIDVMANFLRGAGSVSGGEWHMDEMGGDMLTPSKEVCMQQIEVPDIPRRYAQSECALHHADRLQPLTHGGPGGAG
eukprot:7388062-Prymnesium_polylepis.2